MKSQYAELDPVLTELAIGYKNDAYVAPLMLPFFEVSKQGGKHWIYDRSRFRTSVNFGRRAPGSASDRNDLTLTAGIPYFAEDHAESADVFDEDVDNARETNRDPFADVTEFLADKQLVNFENEVATLLTTAGNWASGHSPSLTGGARWNVYATSDPIKDIRDGVKLVHSKLFVRPNRLLLPFEVFVVLKDHPAIMERVKYSQLGVATPELLARVFEVNEVVIAGAGRNTSARGQADTMSYIWGKNAILAYVNPANRDKDITLGRTYQWAGKNRIVERLRGEDSEDKKKTIVRSGNWYYDPLIVCNEAGYALRNVID